MMTQFTRWLVYGLVAVGLLTRGFSPARALDDPIQLKSGPISGATVDSNINIRVYKGIPYAAPPVGALRRRPPQAVSPWQELRACEQFSPTAHQVRTPINQTGAISSASEDCLYLNVWTSAKTASDKLPVMFWIRQAQIDLISDFSYHRPARDMARGMARVQSRAFMYHFTRNAVEPSAQALYAAEIPYVFMRVPEAMKRLNRDTVDPIDLKLSKTINSYWVQFAKAGDPNANGLPPRPAYDTQSEQYLELVEPIKIGSSLRKDSLDTLDRAIDQRDREFAAVAK